MNWRIEDAKRLRNRRALALALGGLALAAIMLSLTFSGRAPRGGAAAARCEPRDLAVVIGETASADMAYVLDSCGRVTRVPVERGGSRGERQ